MVKLRADLTHAGSEKGAPASWPWTLARSLPLALLLAAAAAFAALVPEPAIDTWISLASGRHIASHGVDDRDPFSFASRPPASAAIGPGATLGQRARAWLVPTGWINQNWGTHLVLFSLYGLGGLPALLAWKVAIYVTVAALLFLNARLRGAPAHIAVAATALALVACRPFTQVRAQAFTDLCATAFFLVITLALRRDARHLWWLAPLFAVWANLHGGFVHGLVMSAVLAACHLVERRRPDRFAALPAGGARTFALAAVAAIAATVVASPYRLSNVIHPLAISIGREAAEWRKVEEWQPLFASGSTRDKLTWAVAALAAVAAGAGAARRRPATRPFDLGAAAMAGVTLAMAAQSLRFIPLSCLVAAPVAAGWLGELVGRRSRSSEKKRAAGGDPRHRHLPTIAAWLAAVAAWAVMAVPFLRWATGPWPFSARRTAVSDRLLSTDERPFDACRFLAANGFSGRMWNFWEEGGFLAWCQTPDPASGRVPLRVFIDGRAQAAFALAVVREYDLQMRGGPGAPPGDQPALTPEQTRADVAWFQRRMRELGVWIAHVPEQSPPAFPGVAFFTLPNWQPIYVDDRQVIVVDTETPEGRAALAAMRSGALVYPEPAWADLTRAYASLHDPAPDAASRAVDLASRSWAAHPTARAVAVAAAAAASPVARQSALTFCREVADEYVARRAELATSHDFGGRLAAARTALELLREAADPDADRAAAAWADQRLALVAGDEARASGRRPWPGW